MLDCAPSMKLTFGGDISARRLRDRVKCAQVKVFPLRGDRRHPTASDAAHTERQSILFARPGIAAVFAIKFMRGFAQVCPAVVASISVNMINQRFRQSATHIDEREPVKAAMGSVYGYSKMTVSIERSNKSSNWRLASTALYAREISCLRIIMQKLLEPLFCGIGHSNSLADFANRGKLHL